MALLRDYWIIIAVAFAVIAALALLIWLWWWVPKWQMQSVTAADPKARADIEDNFRKTVGQALGGAAVLLGAGLAYLQFSQQQDTAAKEALRQQEASSMQLTVQQEASRNSLRASQDLLISNQVAKGFEQLANQTSVMRLGGIYALEGVMNTSQQYRRPVLEALCAFERDRTKDLTEEASPATDIQAALTVIGRRIAGPPPGRIKAKPTRLDLSRAKLPKADLEGANLLGANLMGAHLNGAYLGNADLSGAYLVRANLTDANLNHVDLSGAYLKGPT